MNKKNSWTLNVSFKLAMHCFCVGLTYCKMPAMIISCALMHVSTLGGKNSGIIFLATVKFTSQLCCWFHSLPQTPLVSLFSINSFQSSYAPCNNPGKRARKTLFFLTLIPIDPVLQWYLSLSPSISANRILQTQELEPLIYCTGKWDTMHTGNQTNTTRFLGDWPSADDMQEF